MSIHLDFIRPTIGFDEHIKSVWTVLSAENHRQLIGKSTITPGIPGICSFINLLPPGTVQKWKAPQLGINNSDLDGGGQNCGGIPDVWFEREISEIHTLIRHPGSLFESRFIVQDGARRIGVTLTPFFCGILCRHTGYITGPQTTKLHSMNSRESSNLKEDIL